VPERKVPAFIKIFFTFFICFGVHIQPFFNPKNCENIGVCLPSKKKRKGRIGWPEISPGGLVPG
jgi:hypothetical protein